jgi:hypothetical protein
MSVATVVRRLLPDLLLVVALPSAPAPAAPADIVAVALEIRALSGEGRVKTKDDTLWRAVQPLKALRAGDQVTATGDSRVVLVLTQGRGTRTLTAANSPFTADATAGPGAGGRARETLARVVDFLLGYQKDPPTVSVAVWWPLSLRVAILSPRNTLVLSGSLQFEWTGWQSLRYHVISSLDSLGYEGQDAASRIREFQSSDSVRVVPPMRSLPNWRTRP